MWLKWYVKNALFKGHFQMIVNYPILNCYLIKCKLLNEISWRLQTDKMSQELMRWNGEWMGWSDGNEFSKMILNLKTDKLNVWQIKHFTNPVILNSDTILLLNIIKYTCWNGIAYNL